MSDFMSIAIRARMLKQAMRDGETGLGVPPQVSPNTQPLTDADRAAMSAQPRPKVQGFSSEVITGRSPGRAVPSRLPALLRSRGGKLGLLGVGATGLAGLAGAFNRTPPAPPPAPAPEVPPEVMPPPAPKLTTREKLRGMLHGRTRDAAGTFWNRMTAKYGRRPAPVAEDLA